MEERKYDFYDVKHFLKDEYGLDWKNFKMHDFYNTRKVRLSDIKGEYHFLNIYIPVMKDGREENVILKVTNKMFMVLTQDDVCHDKSQTWQDLLNSKEHSPKY